MFGVSECGWLEQPTLHPLPSEGEDQGEGESLVAAKPHCEAQAFEYRACGDSQKRLYISGSSATDSTSNRRWPKADRHSSLPPSLFLPHPPMARPRLFEAGVIRGTIPLTISVRRPQRSIGVSIPLFQDRGRKYNSRGRPRLQFVPREASEDRFRIVAALPATAAVCPVRSPTYSNRGIFPRAGRVVRRVRSCVRDRSGRALSTSRT